MHSQHHFQKHFQATIVRQIVCSSASSKETTSKSAPPSARLIASHHAAHATASSTQAGNKSRKVCCCNLSLWLTATPTTDVAWQQPQPPKGSISLSLITVHANSSAPHIHQPRGCTGCSACRLVTRTTYTNAHNVAQAVEIRTNTSSLRNRAYAFFPPSHTDYHSVHHLPGRLAGGCQ
jgi:hypothetical protein